MGLLKKLTATAIVAGTMLALASPAQAVITAFASFSPIGQSDNVRWVNGGSGGTFYTTATSVDTVAGTRTVQFSFLQPGLAASVTNIDALFTLNASVPTGNPAQSAFGLLVQDGVSGSFSFTNVAPIVIGSTFYASGSNLLSATFGGTTISGPRNGTTGSFLGDTSAGDTLVYTSDFLTFNNIVDESFSISLNALNPFLQSTPTTSLATFRALAGGAFSADPAPLIISVPEPATWAMMLVGFGMIGAGVRSRKRQSVRVTFA